MKNKLYLPMLVGISLALSTTTGYAKPASHASKKHTTASVKPVKNKKTIVSSKKTSTTKQHTFHVASKHKHIRLKPHTVLTVARASNTKHTTKQIPHRKLDLSIFPDQEIDATYPVPSIKPNTIFQATTATEAPRHLSNAHGIINSSLAASAQQTGLSDELIMQLTSIFAWDIDFATNLHDGDQFNVVYEEGGHSGQIVAAEFVNQGRVFTAIRYKDADGNMNYYSPEGRPMRKAFLSAPVDFARISSGFSTHRKHPILNRIRAHKGVDYAARTGTPVKATGDGEII
ncbi:MAG: metalloendopeptidase, partial [Methylobacter sp.]|nr:metalloendopeptidase [Methylobacter sp.]